MRWSLARQAWPLVTATLGLPACVTTRGARLGPSRPLLYDAGADASTDRPAHVRAASGVVAFGGDLAIIQDDAAFVARLCGNRVNVITLPSDDGGLRLFDDGRGNKADKLDFEASLVLQGPRAAGGPGADAGAGAPGARLVGFGSGSSPRRESLLLIDEATERAEVREVPAFYRGLREHPALEGAQLNLEGSVVVGGAIRLFQRGNGRIRAGGDPVNATLDVDRASFESWLDRGGDAPLPTAAKRWDLGRERGVPYGFTDATMIGDDIVFVAVAEDSSDAVTDDAVLGVAIGSWRAGELFMVPLLEADGSPSTRKVEGIAPDPRSPGQLVVVTDVDDHERPAELCTLSLTGFW